MSELFFESNVTRKKTDVASNSIAGHMGLHWWLTVFDAV